MQAFTWFRSIIIKAKVYISRTASYISIMNTILIMFLFLSDLKKYGIYITIKDWIVPIILAWVGMMIFFGYLEERLGFLTEEQKVTNSRNPYNQEILNRLERIEKRLDKKKR